MHTRAIGSHDSSCGCHFAHQCTSIASVGRFALTRTRHHLHVHVSALTHGRLFRYAPMSLKCIWGLDHFGLLDWPLHTQVPNQMHMQQTQQQLQPIPMRPMQQLPVQQQPPHLQQVSLPGPLPAAGVQRLPVHIDSSNTRPSQAAWFRSRCSRRSAVQQLPTQMVNMQMPQTARTPWLRSTARSTGGLACPTPVWSDSTHRLPPSSARQFLILSARPEKVLAINCQTSGNACDISVVSCVNTHRTPT